MRHPKNTTGVPAAAALTILTALLAVPLAQQPPAPGTPPPAAPAPKPLVPVAANTVVRNPDAYYGQNVTITAAVNQVFSPTAFVVEQRTVGDAAKKTAPGNQGVLVLAPKLYGNVDPNTYVTVMGELVKFDPAELAVKAKNLTIDLAPDIVEKYKGRPALVATGVVNASMVDLSKRLPPPMTAEEEAFSKVMKRVGPANTALRQALDGSNAESTAQNVTVLKQAFTETETFWKTRAKADAIQWAQEARKHIDAIERSASTANWDAAKTSATALGQMCQSCHGAYRERFDDGSFRIKMSAK